jgi:hypothetical protein
VDRAAGQTAERIETWRIAFRHSVGALGRHARVAHRDQGLLLGWRSGPDGAVIYPPRDQGGAGEWVEVGPGAVLLSPLTRSEADTTLARVRLDGAQCGMFARVGADSALAKGTRLRAIVTEAGLTFHPEVTA